MAKTIKNKSGEVFVPVKSFLGQYYLQFRPSKVYRLLGVWRVMEPTPEVKDSDVFIGEVGVNCIKSDRADFLELPFEDILVIMKMAKKMLTKKEDKK